MDTNEKKFVPVMITPFDPKVKVDFDALDSLVEFYLAAGAKGLFAICLSSEMFSITGDERLEITTHIVKQVKCRVPVVATGSFGVTIKDKVEFIKKIYATGIEAAIMVTGHLAKVDDDDELLFRNFEKIFSLTGNIPLGTYECPVPYKRIISVSLLKRLLEADRLIYHKDTSLEQHSIKAKLEALKGVDNNRLEFYDAHTPNAMFSLQDGAKGISSISGNFYPEIMVWMCNNANNPEKQDDVKWIQSEITRVDPLIHEAYPISAKYFLKKRGLPVHAISRAFVPELTPEQKKTFDRIYIDFLGWCDRLGIKRVL
jgi:4-hydroxy-tetrahydrodipicolinate synthase